MPKRRKISAAKLQQALKIITNDVCKKSGTTLEQFGQALGIATEGTLPDLVSAKDAAVYLGLSPKTLANWRSTGIPNLPHMQIGSRIFYQRSDLTAFIASSARHSTSDRIGN